MQTFQKIVLFTAIIILLVSLIFIGISLVYSSSSNQSWPPSIPYCPDYWTMDGSGNNAVCINTKNLGVCPPSSGHKHLIMNFNNPSFTGNNSNCSKYMWANKCKIAWDGITYGVSNPCSN